MTYVGHFPTARKRIRLTFMSTPSPDVYALLPSKEKPRCSMNAAQVFKITPGLYAFRLGGGTMSAVTFELQPRPFSLVVRWRSSIRGRPFLGALTALMRLGFLWPDLPEPLVVSRRFAVFHEDPDNGLVLGIDVVHVSSDLPICDVFVQFETRPRPSGRADDTIALDRWRPASFLCGGDDAQEASFRIQVGVCGVVDGPCMSANGRAQGERGGGYKELFDGHCGLLGVRRAGLPSVTDVALVKAQDLLSSAKNLRSSAKKTSAGLLRGPSRERRSTFGQAKQPRNTASQVKQARKPPKRAAYHQRRRAARDADDQALLQIMRDLPGASIADWAEAIGKGRSSVVSALKRLRAAGLAEILRRQMATLRAGLAAEMDVAVARSRSRGASPPNVRSAAKAGYRLLNPSIPASHSKA